MLVSLFLTELCSLDSGHLDSDGAVISRWLFVVSPSQEVMLLPESCSSATRPPRSERVQLYWGQK